MLPLDFMMSNHNYKQLDLYIINIETKEIKRLTDWQLSNERYPEVSPDGKEIIFISDKNGINNIYKKSIAKADSSDAASLLNEKAVPITNSLSEISQPSISYDGKKLVFTALYKLGYNIFMLNNPFEMHAIGDSLQPTKYMTLLQTKKDETAALFAQEKDTTKIDTTKFFAQEKPDSTQIKERKIFVGSYIAKTEAKKDSSKMDYSRYIFGAANEESDSARIAKRKQLFTEKLDSHGNFLVNRYKVNFSPDLIYANAGYSTLYGLQGTTILAFSDVLGNHRLIGITSLQIDIKNSDYGLAYYYLEKRLDLGIEAFHTARFLYRTSFFGYDLYRFRNFGVVASASYPFNRFYRLDGSLSLMSVTAENLDNIFEPIDKSTYLVPALSFVHDNTLEGYTSPIEGTRYAFTVFGDPGLSRRQQSFYSLNLDYRTYFRFFFDNSFAFRLSGGYSGGGNPQRFFLGGTENWINRNFATEDIPIQSASDFAFLSPAMPLRGYDYAEKIGTKYSLLNMEFRLPLIRYLVTGPLPLLFQNILGVAFLDAGSAWDNTQKLKLFGRNQDNSIVTQDLLIGTGVGFRIYMLFLWKIDVAWKWNLDRFSKPRYYISIGMDF